MSDPLISLSVLAQFHREVFVPDVERIVGAWERRLRDEMHALHEAVLARLDRLEFEYQAIRAGLVRVEERLETLEARFASREGVDREMTTELQSLSERIAELERRLADRLAREREGATRAEVHEVRSRLEDLQARLDDLEKRLPR